MGLNTTGDYLGEESTEYLTYRLLKEIRDTERAGEVFDTFPPALGNSINLNPAQSTEWACEGTLLNITESFDLPEKARVRVLITGIPENPGYILQMFPALYVYNVSNNTYNLVASGTPEHINSYGWKEFIISMSEDIKIKSMRSYYLAIFHNLSSGSLLGYSGTKIGITPYISWKASNLGTLNRAPATLDSVTNSTARFYSQFSTKLDD